MLKIKIPYFIKFNSIRSRIRSHSPSIYWVIVILNTKKTSSQKSVEQLNFFKQEICIYKIYTNFINFMYFWYNIYKTQFSFSVTKSLSLMVPASSSSVINSGIGLSSQIKSIWKKMTKYIRYIRYARVVYHIYLISFVNFAYIPNLVIDILKMVDPTDAATANVGWSTKKKILIGACTVLGGVIVYGIWLWLTKDGTPPPISPMDIPPISPMDIPPISPIDIPSYTEAHQIIDPIDLENQRQLLVAAALTAGLTTSELISQCEQWLQECHDKELAQEPLDLDVPLDVENQALMQGHLAAKFIEPIKGKIHNPEQLAIRVTMLTAIIKHVISRVQFKTADELQNYLNDSLIHIDHGNDKIEYIKDNFQNIMRCYQVINDEYANFLKHLIK